MDVWDLVDLVNLKTRMDVFVVVQIQHAKLDANHVLELVQLLLDVTALKLLVMEKQNPLDVITQNGAKN